MIAPRARLGSMSLLLISLFLVVHAPPSSGQYMYLDANGDGINTAADLVNAGTTVVDVWLDTDSNRDGSPAVCVNGPGTPLTLGSYVFTLRAVNGTIQWGSFTNQLPRAVVQFFHGTTPTEYWNGFGVTFPSHPPGLYRLATLTFSVASGTPSIEIIPRASATPVDDTSFGSACAGTRFDNTIRLGEDWHDADGLAFGGGASNAPVLAQPGDMTTSVGESASQALSATDLDGHPLTFTLVSGPSYANVITVNPGSGTASGAVHLAPFASDIGSQDVLISVSDGTASDQGTLTSTVVPSANHAPHAAVPASVRMAAMSRRVVALGGGDSDGQLLHWRLVSGPAFARVFDLATRPGGVAGILELTPGLGDVGSASSVVGLTDGASEVQFEVTVEVISPLGAPPDPLHTAPNVHGGVAIATGDFNQDGLPDMAAANGAGNSVTIYQTLASGALQDLGEIPTGSNTWDLVTGDVDEDGVLDLVALNRGENSIRVLIGSGQGTFTPRPAQPVGNAPTVMRFADWNRDGFLDLAIGNSGSDDLSLLMGLGDGTFAEAPRLPVGGTPIDLAAGDLNLDGRLDLAVVVQTTGEIRTFRGFGNGTFAPLGSVALGGRPKNLVSADWNGDGVLDFAVLNIGTLTIQTVLGQADGTYQVTGALPMSSDAIATEDVNSDGFADIVVTDKLDGSELRIFRGAGDGTFPTLDRFPSRGDIGLAIDDANRDGFPDIFLTSLGYAEVSLQLVPYGALAEARAFTKNTRPTGQGGGGAPVCIYLEPVDGSYSNTDIVPSTLRLRSPDTGSVDEIFPVPGKSLVESDVDRNGVTEVSICFARSDLTRLFDQTFGRQTVTAYLEGALVDGRVFRAAVSLEVAGGGGGALTATVSPNPLNPRATLRFSTSRDGAVKVRMYDLHGRVVRTLLDRPALPAGSHDVEIDGRAQNGQTLASGIYFYEVEVTEGTVRGRLTILK
jgi:hypothetical protein